MNVGRCQVAKVLMRAFVIAELEAVCQAGGQVGHCIVLLDVNVLVFD